MIVKTDSSPRISRISVLPDTVNAGAFRAGRLGDDLAGGLPRAAPSAIPCAGHGARTEHALVLAWNSRRSSPGDSTLEWMLREAAAGEVFAAGHAETGNDIPVLLSTTKAERVDGGYRFYGHKHFGSLSPFGHDWGCTA